MSIVDTTDLLLKVSSESLEDGSTQSSVHVGLFVTTIPSVNMSDTSDTTHSTSQQSLQQLKFQACVLLPMQAKIGYIEWEETSLLFNLRAFLLQQHPTTCTIFTSKSPPSHPLAVKSSRASSEEIFHHPQDVDSTIIDTIQNELILTSCQVFIRPLLTSSTTQQKSNLIFDHLLSLEQPNDSTKTSSSDSPSTINPKAMFTTSQILSSQQFAQQILISPISLVSSASPSIEKCIATGLVYELLHTCALSPLQSQDAYETALQAGRTGTANSLAVTTRLKQFRQYISCISEQYIIIPLQIQDSLRIDENTLHSLGVLPSPQSLSSQLCLFGLLNKCQIACGTRLLQRWVRLPLLNIYELNQRQLAVSCFIQHPNALLTLSQQYKGIPDIEKIITKLSKQFQQLTKIQQTTGPTGFSQVAQRSDITSDIIKEILHLYFLSVKVRSIVSTLSSIEIPTTTTVHSSLWYNGPHQAKLCSPDEYKLNKTIITTLDGDNDNADNTSSTTGAAADDDTTASSPQSSSTSSSSSSSSDDITTPLTYDPIKLAPLSLTLCPEQFVQIKYTNELSHLSSELVQFERLIEATIDFDALPRHEYLINPTLTDDLTRVNKFKNKIHRALERLYEDVLTDLAVDSSKIKMMYTPMNNIGYCLRLPRRSETLLRGKKGYEIIETRKDGIRFTTSNFRKLSDEYQEQINMYHKIQFHMCYQLLDTVMTYCTVFQHIITVLSEIDVIMSFAKVSQHQYTRPVLIQPGTGITIGGAFHTCNTPIASLADIPVTTTTTIIPSSSHQMNDDNDNDDGPQRIVNNDDLDGIADVASPQNNTKLNLSSDPPTPESIQQINRNAPSHILLRNARHPCLEQQPGLTFIPNDVELIHGQSELQLITGPNMGGKSSYLLSTALNIFLAQIGCFIPCDFGSIYLIDSILARVGAGDLQLKGISTFMKEMLETSELLHYATSQSLIIIDELGRGTSTYDGFGLAWGISEYLATKVHSFTLFATHFHEMTVMSNLLCTVVNKHVTAHTSDDTITMLYNVKPGHCDRSFGIHVAKMANFPQEVITLATHKVHELEQSGQGDQILNIRLPLEHPITKETNVLNLGSVPHLDVAKLSLSEQQAQTILQQIFSSGDNTPQRIPWQKMLTAATITSAGNFGSVSQQLSQSSQSNDPQASHILASLYDQAMKQVYQVSNDTAQ